jgi:hypothetical protein
MLVNRAKKLFLAASLSLILLVGGVETTLADTYCPCRVCHTENRFGWYQQSNGWWAWGPYQVIVCTYQ